MPAPAQNIFHGMHKTGHVDREYTILEERIYGRIFNQKFKIRWSVFFSPIWRINEKKAGGLKLEKT